MRDNPTIARVPDADPTQTRSAADPVATTGGYPTPASAAVPPTASGRYALGDELARGGMGVVYRATDATFDREVAVKVLLDKYGPASGAARRFADEARITGQLQHPAIPPVHDIGTLPDGRPFLAMKLIKGQTLDEQLIDRPDLSSDRGRFVAVFEQVCQAVAYAHAHKVVHRDLKPANVMVGNFGDVQVMDWGLAKVLGSRAAEADDPAATVGATEVQSLRDSDGSFTQAGSVLGTPAYMPPEQALGAISKIDARSDVFGLGAILAVILTGKPPFAASSAETTRIQAAQGKVDECFARLDTCGADPEMVALAKRCLSPAPADRPADAGEVAKAVGDLRAAADERARRAELDRVKAEGEKAAADLKADEQRKRRRVQLALAASVLALAAFAGTGAWLVQRHENETRRDAAVRQERARQTVEQALALSLEHQRRARWAEAGAVLEQAAGRLEEADSPELVARMSDARTTLRLVRRLDAASIVAATWSGDQFDYRPAEQEYAEAFEQAGVARFGEDPAAVAARVAGSPIRAQLIAALDDWAWYARDPARRIWVLAVARAADPQPWGDRFRDPDVWFRPTNLEGLAREANPAKLSPHLLVVLGRVLMVNGRDATAVQVLMAAYDHHANDFWVNFELGSALQRTGGDAEAVGFFRAALATRPDTPPALNNLGTSLNMTGKKDEAERLFRRAIEIDPEFAPGYLNLGVILGNVGRFDEAIDAFRAAVAAAPTSPNGHGGLGQALLDRGRFEEAGASFRRGLVGIPPSHPLYHPYTERLKLSESLTPLDQKLTAVLRGKARPADPAEALQLAQLCYRYKRLYAAAARFSAEAFHSDPTLGENFATGVRYNAACYAARAARGDGLDAPADPTERTALRIRALTWLQADLILYRKLSVSSSATDRKTVSDTLSFWLQDADLSGVRAETMGSEISATERATWNAFWMDVKATLAEARKPPPSPEIAPAPRRKGAR